MLAGCTNNTAPGALKVTTNPNATVFVDGSQVGTSPFEDKTLEQGEVTLKLIPDPSSGEAITWEGLVNITSGVFTVVNYDLAATQEESAGEILTMEPTNQSVASLAVVSIPDGAIVKIDGETEGPTPLEAGQIEPGDHQLQITSPGYEDRTIPISTQVGYKLIVTVKLAKQNVPVMTDDELFDPEATDSAVTDDEDKTSLNTTKITPSPTPKVSKTDDVTTIRISTTPTGWLRVRAEASVSSEELGRVDPGDEFDLLDEQSGWYKIEYEEGEEGWIAGQYAEKI